MRTPAAIEGIRLGVLLAILGVQRAEAARRLGWSVSRVVRACRGTHRLTQAQLAQAAMEFGLDPASFAQCAVCSLRSRDAFARDVLRVLELEENRRFFSNSEVIR